MPAKLAYTVAMSQPTSHRFEITLQIEQWQQDCLDLKMPVWTPGSYLVREYARHLQGFAACDPAGHAIGWEKVAKHHWRLSTPGLDRITVTYQIFAHELTVRTNYLDHRQGYFNGAAMFFFVPGAQDQPIAVTIVPPPDWQVATTLTAIAGSPNHFIAANFDTLVDSPVAIGPHAVYPFEVLGKPHEYVLCGDRHNLDMAQLIRDTQQMIATEAAMFGGLPYDRYQFILHLPTKGYGGLEHKNSCSLIYGRSNFRDRSKYENFLQLVAHEFFHLWNIKRIRPQGLEVFDYEAENYTPSLWFSEGTTSYYDFLIPYRAGLYDTKTYLKNLSQEITRYLTTPGRWVQPLSESSFDAWIKLYRPDANSPNFQMSYYLKGAMVTLLLDLGIRRQHHNQKSFDDVMRSMWQQFGVAEIGFTPTQLQQTIAAVAGFDLSDFFAQYVDGLAMLPFDQYLAEFGLKLVDNLADPADAAALPPFLGLSLNADRSVKFVTAGSPAEQAGICSGDELLAIDQVRVTADQLGARLGEYQAGDSIELTMFQQDVLRQCVVTLSAPRPTQYFVVPIAAPTELQQANFRGWLGVDLDQVV